MTIHRFFVSPGKIKSNKIFFDQEAAKQITKVLRLKVGEKVIALDNTGFEYLVRLEEMISGQLFGTILKKTKNNSESKKQVTLYQALTTKDKFELILQKCTEIGVSKIVPVETKRSLLKVKDLSPKKLERFEKIIQEAAEQSERGLLPKLGKPLKFAEAIINLGTKGETLCAWEDEKKNNLNSVLKKADDTKNISIFIGPEGGFEKEEIIFARKHDVLTITLGPRILRTETAAIVLAAKLLL